MHVPLMKLKARVSRVRLVTVWICTKKPLKHVLVVNALISVVGCIVINQGILEFLLLVLSCHFKLL